MAKDSMTPILLLGGAGLAYWGYTQGWFSSLFPAAAASSSTGSAASSSGAAAGAGTGSGGSSPAAPPTSSPSYSGPSLDQMYQSLQAAVEAAFGVDPALSCAGLSGFGLGPGHGVSTPAVTPVAGRPGYQANPNASGMATRPVGIIGGRPAAPAAVVASTCSNPLATYDVFNYYLVQAVPSVGSGPAPPDHTSVVSLTDYWTWAAPLLKQAMPGLAGGFNGGFGAYAELGMILNRQAGGGF